MSSPCSSDCPIGKHKKYVSQILAAHAHQVVILAHIKRMSSKYKQPMRLRMSYWQPLKGCKPEKGAHGSQISLLANIKSMSAKCKQARLLRLSYWQTLEGCQPNISSPCSPDCPTGKL